MTRIEAHAPGRVLVLARQPATARWLQSLLVERTALVGTRVLDVERLLSDAATELAGPPLAPAWVLGAVQRTLMTDPRRRFDAVAEHPGYQRELLHAFIELERVVAVSHPDEPERLLERCDEGGRDWAIVEAFLRFRASIGEELERRRAGWWRGQSLALVLGDAATASFVHRRKAAIAIDFEPGRVPTWQVGLIERLGFERWSCTLPGRGRGTLALRLSCAGPEVEVAAIARLLRGADPGERSLGAGSVGTGEPEPAAVLAPRESIPRWVARLRHRDVPVRAWIEQPARQTASAHTALLLLRVLSEPHARREDLERILFGVGLRIWPDVAERVTVTTPGQVPEEHPPSAERIEFPERVTPGDLRRAWEEQRSASVSLASLAARLPEAGERAVERLHERMSGLGRDPSSVDERAFRARAAHQLLAAAIERLEQAQRQADAAGFRALLDDWDLVGRAALHGSDGPELAAARVVIETLDRLITEEVAEQSTGPASRPASRLWWPAIAFALDHALALASVGEWVETRTEHGPAPVWVLPYDAVLDRLPARVFVTGLDRHPSTPRTHAPLSDALRRELGLIDERARFGLELRQLDALASSFSGVIASYRHRDGTGSELPPGPWIAGRQDAHEQGVCASVGVDALALPPRAPASAAPRSVAHASELEGVRPTAPIERSLVDWAHEPELARRVWAMSSHEQAWIGTHTGVLGVSLPPVQPYSASTLQSYAELPYRYFVERVLGLGRKESRDPGVSGLLARDQGKVVHRALDRVLAQRLASEAGPVEVATKADELLGAVLEALDEGYRRRAEHGQAEAIWSSERDRWAVELSSWWQQWVLRLQRAWGASKGEAESGARGRDGRREIDETIPAPFVLASEWSPAAPAPGEAAPADTDLPVFELELGPRTIPFVGAIDRIELDPYRRRVNICDYKTGMPKWPAELFADLRAGVELQLPLYALAVEQVVRRDPARLRLSEPVSVGALRLEYIRRAPPRGPGRPSLPVVRGFSPTNPLGVDAQGHEWTIVQAAAGFTLAFVSAIEAGYFPVVARRPLGGRGGRLMSSVRRIAEVVRTIPSADMRVSGLPPALHPLPRSDRPEEPRA